MQDRGIINEEIDPEDFLHVDEDEPTSAISTDEEIVDCIRKKAIISDNEEDSDVEVSILQPSVTKVEALVCIDKLQMYFEQCDSFNGGDPGETAFNCHRIHLTSTKMIQTTLTDYFTPLYPK